MTDQMTPEELAAAMELIKIVDYDLWKECQAGEDDDFADLPREVANFLEAQRADAAAKVQSMLETVQAARLGEHRVIACFGELLAAIHGDGGHYQAEHGSFKAAEDVKAKYFTALNERDAALAQCAMLREAAIFFKVSKHPVWCSFAALEQCDACKALTATQADADAFIQRKVAEAQIPLIKALKSWKKIAFDFLQGDYGERRLGTLAVAWLGSFGNFVDSLPQPHAKLAAAQAKVLKAAKEWNTPVDEKHDRQNVALLRQAVEALEAAENGEDNAGYCDVYF